MRILYCVLNWGLGHATRSIPVIKALLEEGYLVDIASDGGSLVLLRRTFPQCNHHELPGYGITYPSRLFLFNVPVIGIRLLRAVTAEKRSIDTLIRQQEYTAIISDNRYGCYDESLPCILITHQLGNITRIPLLNIPGAWLIARFLSHFNEIWVPDTPDRVLSGRLSEVNLKNVRYIGHLSDQDYSLQPIQYDITAILSGPEPQRTKLEQEILSQLLEYPGKCILVRGLINNDLPRQTQNVTIYPYMDRAGINTLLNSSNVIICRTGYSSLMDLLQVGTKAILIPTPGQPEQVYLGDRVKNMDQFVVQRQGKVDVRGGVKALQARTRTGPFETHQHFLNEAITNLRSFVL